MPAIPISDRKLCSSSFAFLLSLASLPFALRDFFAAAASSGPGWCNVSADISCGGIDDVAIIDMTSRGI